MPPLSSLRTSQGFQAALHRSATKLEDELKVTEEFAPSAEAHDTPIRKHHTTAQVNKQNNREGLSDLQIFVWCVLLVLSGFYFMFWRQEKFVVGFCGVPQSERTCSYFRALVLCIASLADLINEYYPDEWRSIIFNAIRPSCTPCPPHADCYPNFEIACNQDFIYKPHPFHLNGLFPVVGECIPDTEKQRRIAIVAERALSVLRDKAARVECGSELTTGMTEKEIKTELLKFKSGSLSDEEFDALFEAAIFEVEKRDEITVTPATTTGSSK
jgi:Man1-Src1p-C-terminal domain